MKSYIVFSDIHGNNGAMNKLLPLINENSGAIFAGDGLQTVETSSIKNQLFCVKGNYDYSPADGERVLQIEQVKIFLTHGHLYSAKSTLLKLKLRAKELGCKAVIFGHTHSPLICEDDGILFINPGSCSLYVPQKTFVYMVVNGEKITAVINDTTLN